jgi:hypothetical protein
LLLPVRFERCRHQDYSPAATIARVAIQQALKAQRFASIDFDSGKHKTLRRTQQ